MSSDQILFEEAYRLFTGEEGDSGTLKKLLEDLAQGVLRIVKALPKVMRFNIEEINAGKEARRLFETAA